MGDYYEGVKSRDPYTFKKSEEVFAYLDSNNHGETRHPSSISCHESDQKLKDNTPNPVCSHGRIFRLDDDSLLLIQFMRPKVWRIRFDPSNHVGDDFTDYNTRTVVTDTLTELIRTLDEREGIQWHVDLIKKSQYYILQSVIVNSDGNKEPMVQLWIQRDPFQINAIRTVETMPPFIESLDLEDSGTADSAAIDLKTQPGLQRATFWRTKKHPLKYSGTTTLFSVAKPSTADYTGFGEQGGKGFFKRKTYLNYFNFDNMKYANVYGKGPGDDREPLYHSEPYWLEVDGLPSCKSQVATFVDNYSHVCIDLGMTDGTAIRMATRFNSFAAIFVAGDNISEIIQSYTSITGRPRLKPRYALGNHQGGYGYDTREMVLEVAKKYQQHQIPLDGLHVDVDMQEDYRTFTIDKRPGHFPNPDDMFAQLRKMGVKCCTNITPYISSSRAGDSDFGEYKTYAEGLANKHFIMDERDKDPSAPNATDVRYQQWENGGIVYTNPTGPGRENRNVVGPDYWVPDDYKFADVYDSKTQPFHGGVYYGWHNGHPGNYPNLNNREVREWWGKQYAYLFEQGLDFVWQDMTSPCISAEYGDMKSLPFRLMLDSDGWSGDPKGAAKKKAIEIWHLYSYNLHKATYHGLNRLHKTSDKLQWRQNRRNFIIGRGSFAGMHRYAGLWTGDNASTWAFLDISVAQVLAIGLSGITISGADVGGFEFMDQDSKGWADPELLIRWYCAYSLLPWFRNHYTMYRTWFDGPHSGEMRKDGKLFQEPYMYMEHSQVPQHLKNDRIYQSVLPVCRYMIRLRYSLLQLSYDAMFENMLTGLPIARAMIITDEQDRSLFSDNRNFTRSQYLLRNDLLVAPALLKEAEGPKNQHGQPVRHVYLPYPDGWYAMNLRPDEQLGVPLGQKEDGGKKVKFDCHISNDEGHIPYVNPMYIREGAIIPKIEVRDYIPDPSLPEQPPNPITIHIYPGKSNSYEMFLDDGISRDSAPDNAFLKASTLSKANGAMVTNGHANGNGANGHTNGTNGHANGRNGNANGRSDFADDKGVDSKAASKFSKVVITQTSSKRAHEDQNGSIASFHYSRKISIACPHNGFKDGLAKTIGDKYTLVLWHDPETPVSAVGVNCSWLGNGAAAGKNDYTNDDKSRSTQVWVPVQEAHGGVEVEVTWDVPARGKRVV